MSSLFAQLSFPLVKGMRIFQRNRINKSCLSTYLSLYLPTHLYTERDCFTWLWELRSPMILSRHTGHPGKPVVSIRPSLEAWEPGADGVIPSLRVEGPYLSSCSEAEKGQTLLSSVFCSNQAFNGLNDWGAQSTLQSLPIQMLISAGNTLTDTPRNNI